MDDRVFRRLVSQIREGDNQGLSYVFGQTSRYCIRTLIKKTNCSRADAEDIYMDSVMIFRDNIVKGKLTEITNLRTYVFGICWNVWRQLHRSRERWGREQNEVERQLWLSSSESEGPFESDQQSVIRQKISATLNALNQLSEKCRRLLTYVYVEHKSQKEIADLMGFSDAGVVKVTRHRCYKKWVGMIDLSQIHRNG